MTEKLKKELERAMMDARDTLTYVAATLDEYTETTHVSLREVRAELWEVAQWTERLRRRLWNSKAANWRKRR